MPLQVLYAEPRYATRFSWVYLGESAIAGSVSTVAARAFASLLGPPLPGRWSNLYTPPDLWAAWGSFGLLIITAVCSLILQNKAMIHFGNSEVCGGGQSVSTTQPPPRGIGSLARVHCRRRGPSYHHLVAGGADLFLSLLVGISSRRRLRIPGAPPQLASSYLVCIFLGYLFAVLDEHHPPDQ